MIMVLCLINLIIKKKKKRLVVKKNEDKYKKELLDFKYNKTNINIINKNSDEIIKEKQGNKYFSL